METYTLLRIRNVQTVERRGEVKPFSTVTWQIVLGFTRFILYWTRSVIESSGSLNSLRQCKFQSTLTEVNLNLN